MMRSLLLPALLLLSSSSLLSCGPSSCWALSATVQTLHEDNWDQVLQGEWMIEFYAPWCPACRMLQDVWVEFAEWADDLGLEGVAQVDVTENPGLSGRFMVTALPTIFHVKDGVFRQYRGSRNKEDFISLIEDQTWEKMEPLSTLRDPNSPQMTLVSYFFKMSMVLRTVHSTITETYGYPYWVSYVVFAVATIVLGALLGMILVVIIDFLSPPSGGSSQQQQQLRKPITVTQREKDGDDEEENEEATDQDGKEDEEEEEEEDGKSLADENQSPGGGARRRRAKKAD